MLALPRELDWSLLGAAAVLAWGNALSLYSHVLYYDLLAHFFVQLLIAPALYFLLLRATGATVSGSPAVTLVLIFALGLADRPPLVGPTAMRVGLSPPTVVW